MAPIAIVSPCPPEINQVAQRMPSSRSRLAMVGFIKRLLAAFLFVCLIIAYCFVAQLVFSATSIGIYAVLLVIPAILLIWAAPDLDLDWDRFVYPLILLFVTSQIVIPNFYALPIVGIGWVNVRKISSLSLAVVVILAYGLSREKRQICLARFRENAWVSYSCLGFFAAIIISIPASTSITTSIAALPFALTAFFIIFFAVTSLNFHEKRLEFILKWFVINAIPLAIICAVERILGRRIMFDIMPASMIADLLQSQSFVVIYNSGGFRSGAFRAVGSFSVPLSTGECGAMIVPIALYLALYGRGIWNKLLGLLGVAATAVILITANARGGILAAVVVIGVFVPIFLLDRQKKYPVSLFPAVLISLAAMSMPLIALTDRFRFMVFGGGASASSNDGRMEQFNAALPHIMQRPFWGSGYATGADVIGFNPSGGVLTVDSGILSILVEEGLLATIFFLIIFVLPFLQATRHELSGKTNTRSLAFFISLSLLAFLVNTFVLSQPENFGIAFLEVALYLVVIKPLMTEAAQPIHSGASVAEVAL